ncbi:alpha/beta hydrolase [Sorangium sp. So ce1078]|uniref:alpha/beta hydrolase n=1 Tax=Sorangium sp. So ce1078 TaxID=3133329 RepID=UPI003F5DBB79
MVRSVIAARVSRVAWGLVCALLAVALLAAGRSEGRPPMLVARRAGGDATRAALAAPPPSSALPWSSARQTLITDRGSHVLLYPPPARPQQHTPRVILLHGMCGAPAPACDLWGEDSRDGHWLVCPAGNAGCGAQYDWRGGGEEKALAIDDALAAVDAAIDPALADPSDKAILMGFSRGAFVARDVAYVRPGRFRALVLMGASLSPDPARLRASGVERVVLAAGEYDAARPVMQRAARTLDAAGLPARYLSLGRIGHWLPPNVGEILAEALDFIGESPRAASFVPASSPSREER